MNKGFTLAEMLIVFSIIAVLVAVAVPSLVKFRQLQALQNSTNTVVSFITSARSKTVAGADNTVYSVRFENTQAVLFKGTTYTAGASTNEIYTYESPVVLGTVSLNGGSSTVTFDRIRGTTSQHGTLQLQVPNGSTRTITVTSTGSVTRN